MNKPIPKYVSLIVFLVGLLHSGYDFPVVRGLPAPRGGVSPSSKPLPVPNGQADAGDVTASGYPSFRIFSDRDGLPQNTINQAVVDQAGFVWAATQAGAAKYNGRTWTAVDMPPQSASNKVRAMLASRDGGMWFGTDGGGLHRLRDGVWASFTTVGGMLPDDSIRCLAETVESANRTVLWVGTAKGLSKFESGIWTTVSSEYPALADQRILALTVTSGHGGTPGMWVGTDGNGLHLYGNGGWRRVDSEPGTLPNPRVLAVLETPTAKGGTILWVGTAAGLARLENGSWTIFTTADGLPDNTILSLLETDSPQGGKTLWVGTFGGGLGRFEKNRWTLFNTRTSTLPHNGVRCLLETKSPTGPELIWVCTLGGGIARFEQGQWIRFDSKAGLPNDLVYSFLETDTANGGKKYWFGTDNGLAAFENGTWSAVSIRNGLPMNVVYALLETGNAAGESVIWAGTYGGGLGRFEAGRWTAFTTQNGLSDNIVYCLLETKAPDGASVVWAGTGNGIDRFRDGAWTHLGVRDGLPDSTVYGLNEIVMPDGKKTVWACTAGGLAHFDGERFIAVSPPPGIPKLTVYGVELVTMPGAPPVLWIGTETRGIFQILLGQGVPPRIEALPEGFAKYPHATVFRIRQTRDQAVFVFSNKGVFRFVPKRPDAGDRSEIAVTVFSTDDGLPNLECLRGASLVDSSGRVWAGTISGCAVYSPDQEIIDRTPKTLLIERVSVNGERVSLSESVNTRIDLGEFGYDRNGFSVEFALMSFHRESETRYQTQLIGLEKAPSAWTSEFKRDYPSLPGGAYTLRIFGRDSFGNVTGPVDVAFSIKTAPWRTWWAFLGYFALTAGIGYGVFRFRLKALRELNVRLEEKVLDRTRLLEEKNNELDTQRTVLAEKVEQLRISEQSALEAKDRALQSEREAVEASRAKSTFLSNMSHELRTPLNAVIGFAQLMNRDPRLDSENTENVRIIIRSGEHLLGLINDVLSISKIEAGKITLTETVFDFPRLLQGIEEMFRIRAQTQNLQLLFEIAPDLPRFVRGDEGKLRQVLINLIGNAFKFTEAGGVAVRVKREKERFEFEVEDTGHGIASEELGKLFEPFVQTESGQKAKEGTGLGLVISRNFVKLMGGDIAVRSDLGRGTTFAFHVELPTVAETDRRLEQNRQVIGLAPGQGILSVLVVDDKADNRKLLVKLLEPIGFRLFEAANGKQAVEVFESQRPRLVLMDMHMPVMDGYDATRRIREIENKARETENGEKETSENSSLVTHHPSRSSVIIALSASVFEAERKGIILAGCDDFIPKPFRETTLFEKFESLCGFEFLYADDEPRTEKAPSDGVLTRDMFDSQGEEWLAEFKRGLIEGDPTLLTEAAESVRKDNPDFSALLVEHIKAYRFDDLLDIIEENQGK